MTKISKKFRILQGMHHNRIELLVGHLILLFDIRHGSQNAVTIISRNIKRR